MSANPRHLLADHIRSTTTQAKFAQRVGCSEPHLSLILNGESHASLMLARKISAAAKGVIPWTALLAPEAARAVKDVA